MKFILKAVSRGGLFITRLLWIRISTCHFTMEEPNLNTRIISRRIWCIYLIHTSRPGCNTGSFKWSKAYLNSDFVINFPCSLWSSNKSWNLKKKRMWTTLMVIGFWNLFDNQCIKVDRYICISFFHKLKEIYYKNYKHSPINTHTDLYVYMCIYLPNPSATHRIWLNTNF